MAGSAIAKVGKHPSVRIPWPAASRELYADSDKLGEYLHKVHSRRRWRGWGT